MGVLAWVERQLTFVDRTHAHAQRGVRSAALAIRGGSKLRRALIAVVKRSKESNAGQTSRGIPLASTTPLALLSAAVLHYHMHAC
jgi:hypothetical protein